MSDTATLSQILAGIEPDLAIVERTFRERAVSGMELLNAAADHALASPGKRLRTALTLLSGKLIEYRLEKLLPLSVAFEMVHLATLVHDDIIDGAATRRGNPTVNATYGDHVAILLGDYLFARTAGLIAEVEDFRIDRLFSSMVAGVCEGTILELLTARRLDLSVESYLRRITYKTACLMSACCKGGATVCGGSESQIAQVEQFGRNLGIAFQIVDDVLDYVGDEASTGKPNGTDLRQGLVTLPLICSLKHERNGKVEFIGGVLGAATPDETAVADIVAWVKNGPGIPEAMALARRFVHKAKTALSRFAASPERASLGDLADFVLARTR